MPAAHVAGDAASATEASATDAAAPGVAAHARKAPAAVAASAVSSPPGLEPAPSPAARTSIPTSTPCAHPPSQKEAWQARNASRAAVSASAGLAATPASNAVRPRCCATKRQLARPSLSSVTSDANTHVASVACAGAATESSTCMAMHCTYSAGSASGAEQAVSYVDARASQRGSGTGRAPPASMTGDPDPAAVEDAAASTTIPSASALRDARTIAVSCLTDAPPARRRMPAARPKQSRSRETLVRASRDTSTRPVRDVIERALAKKKKTNKNQSKSFPRPTPLPTFARRGTPPASPSRPTW